MNFPVDNKEVLDEKHTFVVSKLKYRIAIITAIFGFVISFITVVLPLAKDVMISDQKQMLRKVKEEMKTQRFKDSLQDIIDSETLEQTYKDINKINELMNNLRKELPLSASVTIYCTHDSGGVPVTGSPLHLTYLYTANNIEPCLGKDYWQNRPIPKGYFDYNYKLYNEKFVYIPDISSDDEIYKGETMEDLDCSGTKALMGIVLKETPLAIYFISVKWNITNPSYQNLRAKIILRRYASEIEPLIQGKKRI